MSDDSTDDQKISDAIIDAITDPKSAQLDGQSATARDASEIDALVKLHDGRKIRSNPFAQFKHAKIIPPGAG